MRRIKGYHRLRYRARYGRYHRFFFLSMALFVAALLTEAVFYGAGGRAVVLESVDWKNLFSAHFTGEALLYLAAFFLGITVYAPAFQFLSLLLRGLFSSYLLCSIAASFDQRGSVPLFVLVLCYVLFSTSVFCGYASFCSMVSLRLFSDGTLKSYRAEEKRMFGGTLFNSSLFCNTVNFRFLSIYTLLFVCAFLFAGAMSFCYSFLCSLFA